jgi:hypothetical protein
MAQTNDRDLNLYPAGQEDSTYTWVLDPPPGRNSFRFVVHSLRPLHVPSPKAHSWSSYFGVISHIVLTMLAFCRTRH